jgi:NAD(P)-dependent dehydrogenase (short-subunit alcohol dehydrogenase family)
MSGISAEFKACFDGRIDGPAGCPVSQATSQRAHSTGKVWLITCDCRALVQALADAVLASGHNLVATAADGAPLKQLLERYDQQLRVLPMDVTDGLTAESAIEATLNAFGRLDVLVLDLAKWRGAITRPQERLGRISESPEPSGSPDSIY